MPSETFVFEEDHTLGMLIQSYCERLEAPFVSYRKLHPLERRIEVKLSAEDPRGLLKQAMQAILDDLGRIRSQFAQLADEFVLVDSEELLRTEGHVARDDKMEE